MSCQVLPFSLIYINLFKSRPFKTNPFQANINYLCSDMNRKKLQEAENKTKPKVNLPISEHMDLYSSFIGPWASATTKSL